MMGSEQAVTTVEAPVTGCNRGVVARLRSGKRIDKPHSGLRDCRNHCNRLYPSSLRKSREPGRTDSLVLRRGEMPILVTMVTNQRQGL
jgi:hypothetical protein